MTARHALDDTQVLDRPGSGPPATAGGTHRDRTMPGWLNNPIAAVVVALFVGAAIITWTLVNQERRLSAITQPVLDRCAAGVADPALCQRATEVRSDPIAPVQTTTTTQIVAAPAPPPVTETATTTVPGRPGEPGPTVTTTQTAGAPPAATVTETRTRPVTRTETNVVTRTNEVTATRTVEVTSLVETPGPTVTSTVTTTEQPPPTVTETETTTAAPPADDGDGPIIDLPGGGLLGMMFGIRPNG